MTRLGARWIRGSRSTTEEADQIPEIDAYGKLNDIVFVKDYQLEGKSAWTGKQEPDLADALERVRRGEFSVIVAWHATRITRMGQEAYAEWLLDLKRAGGELHVATPAPGRKVTMGDLLGWITVGIEGDAAKRESDHKSDKILKKYVSIDSAVWAGGKTWDGQEPHGDRIGAFRGKVPFGYQVIEHAGFKWLLPHLLEAPTIRTAYEMAADGEPQAKIAKMWSEASGKSKAPEAVGKALWNRKLYGLGRYEIKRGDGTLYVHECEPLAPLELLGRALRATESRRTGGPGQKRDVGAGDFSGLLTCARCLKGQMYRKFSHAGRTSRWYSCKLCSFSISADAADKAITRMMSGDLTTLFKRQWVEGVSHAAEVAAIDRDIELIGQRGLSVDEMIAELNRLKAARAAVPEDIDGHWTWELQKQTLGVTFDALETQKERMVMCRSLWTWTGDRGPEPATAVIARKLKDELGLPPNAEPLQIALPG